MSDGSPSEQEQSLLLTCTCLRRHPDDHGMKDNATTIGSVRMEGRTSGQTQARDARHAAHTAERETGGARQGHTPHTSETSESLRNSVHSSKRECLGKSKRTRTEKFRFRFTPLSYFCAPLRTMNPYIGNIHQYCNVANTLGKAKEQSLIRKHDC